MLRGGEDVVHRPMLHHAALIHDGDLIGDLCDDTHVMRMNISAMP